MKLRQRIRLTGVKVTLHRLRETFPEWQWTGRAPEYVGTRGDVRVRVVRSAPPIGSDGRGVVGGSWRVYTEPECRCVRCVGEIGMPLVSWKGVGRSCAT